jgi:hypothetical protein
VQILRIDDCMRIPQRKQVLKNFVRFGACSGGTDIFDESIDLNVFFEHFDEVWRLDV